MSDRATSSPVGAGIGLIAIGLMSFTIHGVHFLHEITVNLQAAVAGTSSPMMTSVLIVLSGY